MDFTSAISHSSSRPLQREIYIPPVSSKKVRREPVIDVTSFSDDGFTDFDLDLTCMSPPGSPIGHTASLSSGHGLLPSPPSPRPLSFLSESPSTLTTSQLQQLSKEQQRRTSQVLPSPKLSSTTSASIAHGSWPVTRYAGRGTPIDRSRRSEWGSTHGTDTVGEDGLLFSTVRSSSLDSGKRSDWITPNMTGVGAAQNWFSSLHIQRELEPILSEPLKRRESVLDPRRESMLDPLPESSKIKMQTFNSDPAEWDSVMQTVLGSGVPSGSSSANHSPGKSAYDDANGTSPIDIETSASGIDMDLRLNEALDLGLGMGNGMNWYELGILSGRAASSAGDSPSAYSTPPGTPRESQSACGSQLDGTVVLEKDPESVVIVQREEPHFKQDVEGEHWWRRVFSRFRKVQKMLRSNRSRM
ncbi:hypothetical protein C8J56DRAFT_543053 [Mycena floridula]|nr:hypothetical protein C8J56DRAFT_543053 [Mycena floridula]